MNMTLQEFAEELVQTVHARSRSTGTYFADAFFDVVTEHLIDAGEIDEAERAYFDSGRGTRVDGYGGDPSDAESKLTLIAIDEVPEAESPNFTQTDMEKLFGRMERFVTSARSGELRGTLEETNPAWGLADLIRVRWPAIRTVRLLIVTNRPLSARVDRKDGGQLDGIPVVYSVWDLNRLHRFISATAERESLEVDFLEEFGEGLPALEVDSPESNCRSFLAAIPATALTAIYDRWGARLLEQNVRVYLQGRSKVNKGILTTIADEPHMFFA